MDYLEAVNRVLVKIGDSEVRTVYSSSRSSRVAQIVKDSLVGLASESNAWPWLNGRYSFDSWVGNKAIINRNILSVHSVSYDRYGIRPIMYEEPERFFHNESTAYDSIEGCPTSWTILGEDFYFNPYPTTSEAQGSIVLFAAMLPQMPLADTDIINLPLRDEDLLILRACVTAAVELLDDGNKANQYAAMYSQRLQQAKHRLVNKINKASLIPRGGIPYA